MRDFLPREAMLRQHLVERIGEVYERYGFQRIETPALEEIDRLLNSEGGDNEKLIYKVLKRGLDFEAAVDEASVVDLGLRYDLTVPLARFFATNSAELLSPFKSIQIAPVWRAERPQKGRYRQFMQCDIDVLGDSSALSEAELVLATADALDAVGVGEFSVRINDRRILTGLVAAAGFSAAQHAAAFIVLDKLDKIGFDGVERELTELSDETTAAAMRKLLQGLEDARGVDETLDAMPPGIDEAALASVRAIVDAIVAVKPELKINVDATLVRGQGYYTGTIFELEHDELTGSLAGGGRYDRMIGKLSGVEVPAVGLSIGFERLFDIMAARNSLPDDKRRVVLLHSPEATAAAVLGAAQSLRAQGDVVRTDVAMKNRNAQFERFEKAGFTHWAKVEPSGSVEVHDFSHERS